MDKGTLEAEFHGRAVQHGGVLLLAGDDALALISRAQEENVPVLGIDGFERLDGAIRPSLEYLADFSSGVEQGDGCWLDARKFVEKYRSVDLLFEIVLGGAEPSNMPLKLTVGRGRPPAA